jgi:MoxR-like ATPase
MSQPRPRGSVSDRLAAAVAAALVGRAEERARLTALLAPHGAAAVFVHGPGGIGKTTLVTGTLAALAVNCVSLDGRHVEPYGSVDAALADLDAVEQLHKEEMIGKYDAAGIDQEDGKPRSSSAR